ncbi:PREDICTED: lysine-specific demethylase 4A-like [Amphimedon queenslandica]|uniref:JmjN domain-containing protein n=1 Tax=Amphimedon queenslandica TaxID=400682 RepID=A0AAN0JFJ4_AMPQE|nr:PREDICTED: lysine-specific demethylase 4A-like [Amphimedon queenslandica]|eukprot:XP_019855571.1 PREDICTED: lysine-specific demethylase 4A-like [Amphimedon queenslandica]
MSGATNYHYEGGIMVFTPSMEEFRDFSSFVAYMESQGAHNHGIAKIIPPKEWIPCTDYSKVEDFVISTPVSQFVNGQQGYYQLYNIQKKSVLSVAGTKHKKILEIATPTKKRKPAEKKQSDWTDNFEGLWQSQPHDFLIERAFNQLLSRGQSKCCICSLFDVPSPFNTYNVSQLYSTVQCIKESKIRSGQSFKKCSICSESKSGACVQCIWPKCYTYLHVTCAQYSSLVPQTLAGKSGFVCNKHTSEETVSISVGDEVYAKTGSSRLQYAHGTVGGIDTLKTYEVQFDDGTLCSEMLLRDIIVNDGAPDLGSCVKVKWSKREIYDARIIGYTTVPQYRVIFDNGTTNTVTEEFIYSLNEPLPRRVKDKLKKHTNGTRPVTPIPL